MVRLVQVAVVVLLLLAAAHWVKNNRPDLPDVCVGPVTIGDCRPVRALR